MIKVKHTSFGNAWAMEMQDGTMVLAQQSPTENTMAFKVGDNPCYIIPTKVVGHLGGVTGVAEWLYNDIVRDGKDFVEWLDTLNDATDNNEYRLPPGQFVLFQMGTPDPRSFIRGKLQDKENSK